ncbi:hypothetical protein LCGC14_1912190 [marine sediment metagenome]|uniref:Uncharacterized protein n=1 Tax=marine sediment metagenome TaxID=412755 RepID=A0A0F9GGG2_9ZZZZ
MTAPYATGRTQCVHHDRIEMPHGPVSIGVCQLCGREREYDTSLFYEYNVKESLKKTPVQYQQERIWDD